jgi:hypothetical protein
MIVVGRSDHYLIKVVIFYNLAYFQLLHQESNLLKWYQSREC